jgi:putative transposase
MICPGVPIHIVQRGHNRLPCFRTVADFLDYRRILGESASRMSCEIHAYVLMTNHVHILLTPPESWSAARMMHRVAGVYGSRFNQEYGRTGTLWESRYWSCLIDSERHLLACSRYVELNPVRAGMVGHPRDYDWSSYRGNAESRADRLLTPHSLYIKLGHDPAERAEAYGELFSQVLEPSVVNAIRRSPRREPKTKEPVP